MVTFSVEAIKQLGSIAERLRRKSDPVSAWLWTQLDDHARDLTMKFQIAWDDPEPLQLAITDNFNRVIRTSTVYEESRFQAIALRPETKELLSKSRSAEQEWRLNRLLLEDCYAQELSRNYEMDFFAQEFNARLFEWAKTCFLEEAATGFRRAQKFDALRSQRYLAVLRQRPETDLEILARVLPKQVLFDSPRDVARRNALPPNEKAPVERLHSDLKTDQQEHSSAYIMELAGRHHSEVKREFNVASQIGSELVGEIAKEQECEAVRAARGEWGLIFVRHDVRYCVSVNLTRYMLIDYSLSLSNCNSSYSVRFHDNYLGVLGIGGGEWFVRNAQHFPEQLRKAVDFALWHREEYEKMAENVRTEHEIGNLAP